MVSALVCGAFVPSTVALLLRVVSFRFQCDLVAMIASFDPRPAFPNASTARGKAMADKTR